jgi:hypothetical protein
VTEVVADFGGDGISEDDWERLTLDQLAETGLQRSLDRCEVSNTSHYASHLVTSDVGSEV